MRIFRAHRHWLPVLLWMSVIFALSTRVGSSANTSRIIIPFLHHLFPALPPTELFLIHRLARKASHVAEYAILSYLILRAMIQSWRNDPVRSGNLLAAAVASLCVASAYAATDELHQRFVPGRESQLNDVLIDASGAGLGLLVAAYIDRHSRLRSLGSAPQP